MAALCAPRAQLAAAGTDTCCAMLWQGRKLVRCVEACGALVKILHSPLLNPEAHLCSAEDTSSSAMRADTAVRASWGTAQPAPVFQEFQDLASGAAAASAPGTAAAEHPTVTPARAATPGNRSTRRVRRPASASVASGGQAAPPPPASVAAEAPFTFATPGMARSLCWTARFYCLRVTAVCQCPAY